MADTKAIQWQAFSDELADVAERVGRSVVTIHSGHRQGSSGVLWDAGSVVTTDHSVQREEEVPVTFAPGKTVTATVAGRDPSTDLAVLKLSQPADVAPAQFGGDTALRIGSYVLALARTRRGNLVASGGLISGLMGPWRAWRGGEIDQFIRPDLNLYPGFSGGPLVNAQAKVVGINSPALRRGTGLTIPQTTIWRVVKELLERGHIAQPYLGVAMQPTPIPESMRKSQQLESTDVLLVMHVHSDGPGGKAGLLLGDVVLEIAGKPVSDTEDVRKILRGAAVGAKIEIKLLRGGERKTIEATLEERPLAKS